MVIVRVSGNKISNFRSVSPVLQNLIFWIVNVSRELINPVHQSLIRDFSNSGICLLNEMVEQLLSCLQVVFLHIFIDLGVVLPAGQDDLVSSEMNLVIREDRRNVFVEGFNELIGLVKGWVQSASIGASRNLAIVWVSVVPLSVCA